MPGLELRAMAHSVTESKRQQAFTHQGRLVGMDAAFFSAGHAFFLWNACDLSPHFVHQDRLRGSFRLRERRLAATPQIQGDRVLTGYPHDDNMMDKL